MNSEHVGLDTKVAFLSSPGAFADAAERYREVVDSVETVETHMAWVFLTDRFAYKLKKPVKLPFLDFSTIERRKEDCRLEIELNRRLAGGVYLGMVPLSVHSADHLKLGGGGQIVDWLVRMRRLPRDKMLDERIRKGTLTHDEIRRIGVLLSSFYRTAPPEPVDGNEYVGSVGRDIRRNHAVLRNPRYGLPDRLVKEVFEALNGFNEKRSEALAARAAARRIVEAHGDLRPEHICLEARPVVFDCLEFRRSFRVLDAVEEISFLAMECDRLGATFVGPVILDVYRHLCGDAPPDDLVAFYKLHRASLRAKLSVWHHHDHGVDMGKWTDRATEYLRLAYSYKHLIAAETATGRLGRCTHCVIQ